MAATPLHRTRKRSAAARRTTPVSSRNRDKGWARWFTKREETTKKNPTMSGLRQATVRLGGWGFTAAGGVAIVNNLANFLSRGVMGTGISASPPSSNAKGSTVKGSHSSAPPGENGKGSPSKPLRSSRAIKEVPQPRGAVSSPQGLEFASLKEEPVQRPRRVVNRPVQGLHLHNPFADRKTVPQIPAYHQPYASFTHGLPTGRSNSTIGLTGIA